MITACSEKVSRGLVVWSSNNKCQIFFLFKLAPFLSGMGFWECWDVQVWRNPCIVILNLMV